MENDGSVPLSLRGRMNDSRGDLLDAVATVDRLIASLTATRAELIDGVRAWVETAEQIGRPASGGRWSDATVARQVLVTELAAVLRISERAAARLASESETLVAELPAILDSLREGHISYAHAAVVVDQAWSLPPEAREPFAVSLLPYAEALSVGAFARIARRRREAAHPDSLQTRRRSAFERRNVGVDPAHDGMAWLTAYLPAEQAIGIDDRLDRIATSLQAPDETRSLAQLRTDAFAEVLLNESRAEAGVGIGAGQHHGIHAQILVTVPVLTLLGSSDEPATLEGYGPIDADTARRIAGHAPGFTRILTHPETGAVLSVGRRRYVVPVELKRAVRARDETCRAVGCGRRAASCDLDHTTDWRLGGATGLDNLAHLCRRHHRLKHQTDWMMRQRTAGVIEWTSPTGRQYFTEPATASPPAPRRMRT